MESSFVSLAHGSGWLFLLSRHGKATPNLHIGSYTKETLYWFLRRETLNSQVIIIL